MLHKEGLREAGLRSFFPLCTHSKKCEAVEIDLLGCLLVEIYSQNNLYYIAYGNIPHYVAPYLFAVYFDQLLGAWAM